MFEQLKGFFISLLITSITISIGVLAYWVVSCQDIVPGLAHQPSHQPPPTASKYLTIKNILGEVTAILVVKDLMHRNVIHILTRMTGNW